MIPRRGLKYAMAATVALWVITLILSILSIWVGGDTGSKLASTAIVTGITGFVGIIATGMWSDAR